MMCPTGIELSTHKESETINRYSYIAMTTMIDRNY